jgi:hypothetical protein
MSTDTQSPVAQPKKNRYGVWSEVKRIARKLRYRYCES